MAQRSGSKSSTVFVAIATLCAGLAASQARSEDTASWPSHPVRFIVPASAGGGNDIASRMLAEALTKALGQPFVVDNIGGAGNILGVATTAKAPADGYTIVSAPVTVIDIVQFLRNDLNFSPEKDLIPVTKFFENWSALVVSPTFPAKTYDETIKVLRANPGKYNYASDGVGGLTHLQMELFLSKTGLKLNHVPFKGGNEEMLALIGGQVDVAFSAISTSLASIQAGRLQAIATLTRERAPELPNVPTVKEFIPSLEPLYNWGGIFVPAGTPAPIVDKLYNATATWLHSPEGTAQLRKLGSEPGGNSPADFAASIARERAIWPEVIKAANIKIE